jgi:hypothetical protein
MLITHVGAARTRMMTTATPAIRPVETFDFEDVKVTAGNEGGVGEPVALAERAELVIVSTIRRIW